MQLIRSYKKFLKLKIAFFSTESIILTTVFYCSLKALMFLILIIAYCFHVSSIVHFGIIRKHCIDCRWYNLLEL